MQETFQVTPLQIEPLSPLEMWVRWNQGEQYSLPYFEMRYYCPCAGCVDENTGQRTVQRTAIAADIRPAAVHVIGKYAIQIDWNDGHSTGIYHFDRLFELCQKVGRLMASEPPSLSHSHHDHSNCQGHHHG